MRYNPKPVNLTSTFAILGLVSLAVAFMIVLLLPELRISAWIVMGLGIALLGIAFIIDFKSYSRAIASRRGRLRLGTALMGCIFFGIVLFVNAISSLYYHRFDLSSLSQFTLTPQTKKVINDLKRPVKAIGFFVPDDPYNIGNYIKSLLKEYDNNSRLLTVQLIDPDQHPDEARKYGITEYQTVVFECMERHRIVSPSQFMIVDEAGNVAGVKAEHSFTSAILEVTGLAQKKVYFLTGHGEAGIEANLSKVKEGLLDDLYIVDTLNIKKNPSVPDDCAVLIIASPKTKLSDIEVNKIDNYLINGGQALILTDPDSHSIISPILINWGVNMGNGSIIDPSSSVAPHKDMPLIPSERNYFLLPEVYFPGATAIIPQGNLPAAIQMMPLVYTDKSSWLDRDFIPGKEPVFNPEREKMESLAIGALITGTHPTGSRTDKITRLIVIGDSDFASNRHFDNGYNGDLFLNSINWLAEETSLISVRRNVQPFRRLVVTPNQVNIIRYLSVGLIPFLLLVTAGIIWWRRR